MRNEKRTRVVLDSRARLGLLALQLPTTQKPNKTHRTESTQPHTTITATPQRPGPRERASVCRALTSGHSPLVVAAFTCRDPTLLSCPQLITVTPSTTHYSSTSVSSVRTASRTAHSPTFCRSLTHPLGAEHTSSCSHDSSSLRRSPLRIPQHASLASSRHTICEVVILPGRSIGLGL